MMSSSLRVSSTADASRLLMDSLALATMVWMNLLICLSSLTARFMAMDGVLKTLGSILEREVSAKSSSPLYILVTIFSNKGISGSIIAVFTTLKKVWKLAMATSMLPAGIGSPMNFVITQAACGTKKRNITEPTVLVMTWTNAARLPFRLAPTEASNAVTVVPMLLPRTSGIAAVKPIRGSPSGVVVIASFCMTAITALLL